LTASLAVVGMLVLMPTTDGRIKFPGNPWPKGHPIKKAKWSASLSEEGLRFHFHVESRDYDLGDKRPYRDEEEDMDDDWKARIVWNNYHSCILSSTYWGHPGFLVAAPGNPLDLERLEGKTFRVDRTKGDKLGQEYDREELSFGIYLLGHDAVCDHRIRFVKRRGPATYDIHWRARIALTYSGKQTLAHELDLVLPKLPFAGITVDSGLSAKGARELLPQVLVKGERYKRVREKSSQG